MTRKGDALRFLFSKGLECVPSWIGTLTSLQNGRSAWPAGDILYCRICKTGARRGEDVERWVGPRDDAESWFRQQLEGVDAESLLEWELVVQPALEIRYGGAAVRVGAYLLVEGRQGLPGGLLVGGELEDRAFLSLRGPRIQSVHGSLERVSGGLLECLGQAGLALSSYELIEFGVVGDSVIFLDIASLDPECGYGPIGRGELPRLIGRSPEVVAGELEVSLPDLGLRLVPPRTVIMCSSGARLSHLATYASEYGFSVMFGDGMEAVVGSAGPREGR